MPPDENALVGFVFPEFYANPAAYYDRQSQKEVVYIFHAEKIGHVMLHIQSDSGVLSKFAAQAILEHNALTERLAKSIAEAGEMRKLLQVIAASSEATLTNHGAIFSGVIGHDEWHQLEKFAKSRADVGGEGA